MMDEAIILDIIDKTFKSLSIEQKMFGKVIVDSMIYNEKTNMYLTFQGREKEAFIIEITKLEDGDIV